MRCIILLYFIGFTTPLFAQEAIITDNKKIIALTSFYANSTLLNDLVDATFNTLSLDEQVAQMIMPAVSSNNFGLPPAKAMALYNNKIAGGFLFLKGSTSFFKRQFLDLKSASYTNKLMPALISADAEAALMHYKFTDKTKMKAAEAQNSILDVKKSSEEILSIIKDMGITINFAPVVDNNINRAIIKNRSFGSDIVPKANTFVKDHQKNGVAATIKHFPGHGSVTGDSHKGLVSINGTLTEVDNFEAVIKESNPIGVMVGHIAVNTKEWNSNGVAATLSRKITTELLKENIGFNGIVFTDALNMGAVSKIKGASYLAACAGADVLLMPMDPETLHQKIKKEIENKGNYAKQFEASIKKIIRLKYCLGLMPGGAK